MIDLDVFVITDCGSTTTKAILIENIDGVYRQRFRGESPTTVESPVEDVTVGVKQALKELGEFSGRRLINENNNIIKSYDGSDISIEGCTQYLSTSSAGGGLQMVVMGMVREISANSALRAALGAGAIVFDTIAFDDFDAAGSSFSYIETLRNQRPDMVLLAGGTNGGQREGVVELAELLAAAAPRPRFGNDFEMPVIYAGNVEIADEITRILKGKAHVIVEKNVRPDVDNENISAARDRIHHLFLEHVMQQSPGFSKLGKLVDYEIVPTPSAVGDMLKLVADKTGSNVLCVDIGGATTDLFSVVDGIFNRTVSANLGMSYSAAFVLEQTGLDNILRWVNGIKKGDVYNQILNKTVRPTTIPETAEELMIEHALAREALSLSFLQHCEFSKGLQGTTGSRNIDQGFSTESSSLVNAQTVDMLIASGGVLSHAPLEIQTVAMMVDAFLPSGVTTIAKDSIFMLPHLGVLSRVNPAAAIDVFEHDCIINLCTCIAPIFKQLKTDGKKKSLLFTIKIDKTVIKESVNAGELLLVKVPQGKKISLSIRLFSGWSLDGSRVREHLFEFVSGTLGVLFDCRNRPLSFTSKDLWTNLNIREFNYKKGQGSK